MKLAELVESLTKWRDANPKGSKRDLAAAITAQSDLKLDKALLIGSQCVLRISQMNEVANDSNAVLSFRKLFEHDHLPVIICLLTSRGMRLLLGNTSFIERVSDRSYRIAVDNLTGSILDSDIASALDGVANLPNNFEQLWAVHQGSDRAANVERIVAATKDVHASEARANPGRVKLSSKPR